MANVLIVAHLLIVLALIAVILLQRSEGGGLGMGSNPTGLMTVRGTANVLTRTTAILAALFFATSVGLTIINELDRGSRSILERAADTPGEGTGAPTSVLDALNSLNSDSSLAVPEGDGTTAPAADGAATTAPATDGAATTAPAADGVGTGAGATADPALAVPATTPAPGDTGAATEAPATGTEQPAADGAAPAAPVN